MPHKVIQVGTGGMGRAWCRLILPPAVERGAIEVVAAVDIDPEALTHAQDGLELSDDRLYTDVHAAVKEHPDADIITVVVPPAFHEEVVRAGVEHGMHVLSEKPIADTLDASIRIANLVREAGVKMGVTMNHRFDVDKTTFRREVQHPRNGDLDYLVGRFTCAARTFGTWGRFRHEIADPLMIEGAVHHLDILDDLAGGRCTKVFASTWKPAWGEYAGDCQALVLLEYENGVRVQYEGTKAVAVTSNTWGTEYIRAECDKATVVMDHREVRRYDGATPLPFEVRPTTGDVIPLAEGEAFAHSKILDDFLVWLDGGPAMATNVEANLRSLAVVFAAIESSGTGLPIDPAALLERKRAEVAAR
jgi:predicted dehydrogenase